MKLFQSIRQQLHLKTQLLIAISLLIAVIVSFQVASIYVNKILLEFYLMDSSSQINTINQNVMISQMVFWYQRYFHNLFDIRKNFIYLDGNALIQFHQLYNYIRRENLNNPYLLNPNFEMNYGGVNQIPQTIAIPRGMRNYTISYSFLCYAQKYNQGDLLNIKMQEQLQAYGQILFGEIKNFQTLFSSYIERDDMLMTYPCLQRYDINDYIPQARYWYVEATKVFSTHQPYNQYNDSVTQPYLFFNSSNVALSTVLPMVDEKQQQIGSLAFELTADKLISDVFQQFGQGFTLIYLISPDGILILHPYNVTSDQLPLYIYNESITGFSQQNWQEFTNGKQYCSKLATFKCVYNTYFQQQMIVSLKKLIEYNLYILVAVGIADFKAFSLELNDNIETELYHQFYVNLLQHFLLFICSAIFIIIMTKILFYPLELIMKITFQKFYQMNSNDYLSTNAFYSSEMKKLFETCQKFNHRVSTCKAKECKIMEKQQFPLRQRIYLTHYLKYYFGNNKIWFSNVKIKMTQRKLLNLILTSFKTSSKSQ